MAAFAPGGTADPKKGATFSDTCDNGQTVELTFYGNGDFTPGHLHLRHHSHRPRRDVPRIRDARRLHHPSEVAGSGLPRGGFGAAGYLLQTVAAPQCDEPSRDAPETPRSLPDP